MVATRRSGAAEQSTPAKKRASEGGGTPLSRQKNKVQAKVPALNRATVESPPIEKYDDLSSVSCNTEATPGGSRGLDPHVAKQLAIDIEESGGISAWRKITDHTLSRLLNKREELYGKRGDPIRRKLRRKVWEWKQHSKDEYTARVLHRYGIRSFAELQEEDGQKKGRPKRSDSDEDSSSSSSDDGSSASSVSSLGDPIPSPSPVRKGKKTTAKDVKIKTEQVSGASMKTSRSGRSKNPPSSTSQPLPSVIGSGFPPAPVPSTAVPAPVPSTAVPSTAKPAPVSMANPPSPRKGLPTGYTEIIVNVDRPEANGEIYVFKVKDLASVKNEENYVEGYHFMMRADPRHYYDKPDVEWIKSRLYMDNQVLLTMPAYPYSLLHVDDSERDKHVSKSVAEGFENAKNYYEDNKTTREFKHILLTFPYEERLSSSEIFAKAGEDEWLKLEMYTIEWEHEEDPGKKHTDYYAGFNVARVDTAPYKKGKREKKDRKSVGASILEQLKSGMST